jgi:hypothetical protein
MRQYLSELKIAQTLWPISFSSMSLSYRYVSKLICKLFIEALSSIEKEPNVNKRLNATVSRNKGLDK